MKRRATGRSLAAEAVIPAPPPAVGGARFDVQSAAVEQLDGFRLRLRGADGGVGRRLETCPKGGPLLQDVAGRPCGDNDESLRFQRLI